MPRTPQRKYAARATPDANPPVPETLLLTSLPPADDSPAAPKLWPEYRHYYALVAVRDPTKIREAFAGKMTSFADMELIRLGFPPTVWMPIEMARMWRSRDYPACGSLESFQEWRTLMNECISFVNLGSERGFRPLARTFVADRKNDEELLRRFCPEIDHAGQSPAVSAALQAPHIDDGLSPTAAPPLTEPDPSAPVATAPKPSEPTKAYCLGRSGYIRWHADEEAEPRFRRLLEAMFDRNFRELSFQDAINLGIFRAVAETQTIRNAVSMLSCIMARCQFPFDLGTGMSTDKRTHFIVKK